MTLHSQQYRAILDFSMKQEPSDSDAESKKKLIVNYIPQCMNQEDVRAMFERIGPVASCKLVRNHQTGASLGFAFIEYHSEDHAEKAVLQINGVKMQDKTLRVNFARKMSPETKNANVYVAGLPNWVNDGKLTELFSEFGEIVSVKVLYNTDASPRGVGFVRFNFRRDAEQAIECMAGRKLKDGVMPLIVKLALPPAPKSNGDSASGIVSNSHKFDPSTASNPVLHQSLQSQPHAGKTSEVSSSCQFPAGSTTGYSVYVYGMQPHHTELTLYQLFSPFGAILNVRAMRDLTKGGHPGKGFGFVNFVRPEDAYRAIKAMNNCPYDGKVLQVSVKATRFKSGPDQASMAQSLSANSSGFYSSGGLPTTGHGPAAARFTSS